MKEAAGEANLTVVAIILIAVVVAVATPLVGSLMKGATWKSCCTDAGGVVNGSKCQYKKTNTTVTKNKTDMYNSTSKECNDITW